MAMGLDDELTPLLALHPGEYLSEILDELGVSAGQFGVAIGVAPVAIEEVVERRASITCDMALRIGKALSMEPLFWLEKQNLHDLGIARLSIDTSGIVPLIPL